MHNKNINPGLIVGFFSLLGVAAYFLDAPENVISTIFIVVFCVLSRINIFGGIVFILLSAPFFLGESGWPYYWMTEVLVYVLIISAIIVLVRGKKEVVVPLQYPLLLLLFASLCSLPIDFKELYYDLWTTSFHEMYATWLSAHPAPKTHYLRVLTNMGSGMALFVLTFHFARKYDFDSIRPVFQWTVILCGVVSVASVLMRYDMIPIGEETWRFLTLSLVGNYQGSITAFSFALHFFNQYLLLVFPMAIYFCFHHRSKPLALALHIAIVGIITFCIVQGGLRAAGALLFFTLLIAVGMYIRFLLRNKKIVGGKYIVSAFILVVIVAGYLMTQGLAYQRFSTEILAKLDSPLLAGLPQFIDDPLYFLHNGVAEPRLFLWHTAIVMFGASPLLGIGLGRYTHLFLDYYASDYYNWGHIGFSSGASAHSIYFETLANQGIIGFILWSLLVGSILLGAIYAIRRERDIPKKAFYIAIFASIILWLAFGLIHLMTLCRIIEIYFWIMLGFLTAYSWEHIKPIALGKKKAFVAIGIISLAFIYQLNLGMARPIPDDYSTGFYGWEKKPDGRHYRWMTKRGVYMAKVIDGKISISMVVTLDGLESEPQKINIWVDGVSKVVIMPDRKLHTVEIPVKPGVEQAMVWMEANRVYDPAERRIGRVNTPVSVMIQLPEVKAD